MPICRFAPADWLYRHRDKCPPRIRKGSAALVPQLGAASGVIVPSCKSKRYVPLLGLALASTIFTVGLAAQTGPQPGATDPIGSTEHLTLFPDDEVVAFEPGQTANTLQQCIYRTDQNKLKLGQPVCTSVANLQNPMVAASGRILDPSHESVVTAQRNGASTQIVLSITDPKVPSVPQNVLDSSALADRTLVGTDAIAIAVGDVDKLQDSSYNYHDEVVVAYLTQNGAVAVEVANYGNSPDGSDPKNRILGVARPAVDQLVQDDNPLAVAIGDFDGDGNNEIAVTLAANDGIHVFLYRVVVDANNPSIGTEQLNLVSSFTLALPGGINGETVQMLATNSTVADDLNGDGIEELAIGVVFQTKKDSLSPADAAWPFIYHVTLDSNLNLKSSDTVSNIPAAAQAPPPSFAHYTVPFVKIQLATGQFLFNPPAIPFGQHQLIAAWNYYNPAEYIGQINLQLLSASSGSPALTPVGSLLESALPVVDTNGASFSLAAGGFTGNSNIQSPTSEVSIASRADGSNYYLATFQPSASGVTQADISKTANSPYDSLAPLPVVAADWAGQSVYLGAPAHITIENAISTDYILEEPPKHSYWDGTQVNTISNYDSNNVSFSYAEGSTSSTKSTDHSNWTIGGSVAVSAGETAEVNEDAFLAKTDEQESVDVSVKASYQYNQDSTSYNSSYSGRNFTIGSATDHDDTISGRLQTIDVWRYRIYGLTQTDPNTNTFYDIMLPGPVTPFYGAGMDFDWYQPIHENGNILTYPQAFNSSGGNPPDVGSWTDPGSGQVYTGVLIPIANWFFDGNTGSESIALNQGSATGNSFDYSHTLSESADVKASASAKIEVGGASAEGRISGEVSFNNSNSWGTATTNDNTTSTQTTISLTKGSMPADEGYEFDPITYVTQDGTFKMSFIVPNPAGSGPGAQFWASQYGSAPDPALNLPHRFQPTYSDTTNAQNGWALNTTSSARKKIRGLFFRQCYAGPGSQPGQCAPDPVTQDYPFLNSAAVTGNLVRLEARVYNESTAMQANNITVQFQEIPYDSASDNEVCDAPINAGLAGGQICPASARTVIGQTTIGKLGPLQFTCLSGTDDPTITGCNPQSVFINWDTTKYGPSAGSSATNSYRIYVVLIPGDPKELYGSDGVPESIQNMTNATPITVTTANPHNLHTGDYVAIAETGLQLPDDTNHIFQVTAVDGYNFTLNGTTDVAGTYSGDATFTPINPGENDEGYAEFDIQGASTSLGAVLGQQFDDYLNGNSLQAIDLHTDKLTNGTVTAYQNRPVRLRVGVFSSVAHPEGVNLLLFDGDPAQGAPAIASQLVHPGNNGGNGTDVWFNWTPATTGTHHLYAKLLESGNDAKIGNATSMLQVDVFRPGDVNGDGKVDRADLNEVLQNVGKSASQSSCGPACDLNGDGSITVLDMRKLALICGPTACGVQ